MYNALKTAEILLPGTEIDVNKWAVVACDQFTAQPQYWRSVEEIVKDAPSALHITLPEIWLDESEKRIPAIHAMMNAYLDQGVLRPAVKDGFILVERSTKTGVRPGLIAALDLEEYDFSRDSRSLIRATEGTVIERVPPRAHIRADAPLEIPHVMMLIDDPDMSVIEPLLKRKTDLRKLYDFDLMMEGGHITGWAIEGEDTEGVFRTIDVLNEKSDGLLYAVGDGNHSLAAARQCWLNIREKLSQKERQTHPARYALVELVNLQCPALMFEPIHRVLCNVQPETVIAGYVDYLKTQNAYEGKGEDLIVLSSERTWRFKSQEHPLRLLQAYLDAYMKAHPEAEIDYIHGEAALRKLVNRPDVMGFMPRTFAKEELFDFVRRWGALPRKTFSMGEANEKRYYLEARKIL